MKILKLITLLTAILLPAMSGLLKAQTLIPNGGFESWNNYTGYSNPTSWDTPNSALMGIFLFGKAVVYKSADFHGGTSSCKLLTQNIAIPGSAFNAPGFITLGKLHIDIISQTFSVDGGVPINDQPTHLMGFYKFQPTGGDSCTVGILLYKTTAGVRDTIGGGLFSAKVATTDWTHFSAYINYTTPTIPDTMNIMAISSAQTDMHAGTALWVDDLSLDYTVGVDRQDPAAGISVYHDKETGRLIVFCEFTREQSVNARLYDMTGREVYSLNPVSVANSRIIIPCNGFGRGVYVLVVQHDGMIFTKKILLGL
ncbi:MAG: PCMD domain-containing protein [Bacteroidota bacterium]